MIGCSVGWGGAEGGGVGARDPFSQRQSQKKAAIHSDAPTAEGDRKSKHGGMKWSRSILSLRR